MLFEPISVTEGAICNNYICIEPIPDNHIKINEFNIRFAEALTGEVRYFNVDVNDDGDQLVLNYEDAFFEEKIYNIIVGISIKGKFIPIKRATGLNPLYLGPTSILPKGFTIGKSVLTQVITRGTCYKSGDVVMCYD